MASLIEAFTGVSFWVSAASNIKISLLAIDKLGVDVFTLSFWSITVSFGAVLPTSDNKISAVSDIKTSSLEDSGELRVEKLPVTFGPGVLGFSVAPLVGVDVSILSFLVSFWSGSSL